MPPKKANETKEGPKNQTILNAFAVQHQNQNIPSANMSNSSQNTPNDQGSTSRDSFNPTLLYQSIEKVEKIGDVKSTLLVFAKALENITGAQNSSNCIMKSLNDVVEELSYASGQLTKHVNNQITKIEDDLAIHKNITDDKLMSLKVTSDIRHSKYFLKILMKDEKRMRSISKVNALTEASKILNELELSVGESRIVKAETRFEGRNIFGKMRFINFVCF